MVKHVSGGFLQVFCKQYSQLCHCHSLSVPARSCDQMISALCIFFPHQPPLRQRLPLQHNTYFPFQPHVFGQNLECAFNKKQQDAQIYSYSTVVVFSQPINISPALLAFVTYSWPQVLYQTVPDCTSVNLFAVVQGTSPSSANSLLSTLIIFYLGSTSCTQNHCHRSYAF